MAQAKLARNNPKVTAPRIVNGPTLLTGLAACASCGSGMTRTGTARGHRSYSYYTCADCHQKGKSVYKGRHIPMGKLDTLIIEGVKSQLFELDRMATILAVILDRQTTKEAAVEERRVTLKFEIKENN